MSYQHPEPPVPTRPDTGPAHGHPSPERLAALADGSSAAEQPSAAEERHLADCARCRGELRAHHVLVRDARRERDRVAPPLTRWDSLADALRAEGLARPAGVEVVDAAPAADVLPLQPVAAARHSAPLASAARLSAPRLGSWTARRMARAAAVLLLAGGGLVAGRVSAGADPIPGLAFGDLSSPERTVAAILADTAAHPSSADEAMAILTRAERDYRLATAYLADEAAPGWAAADRPEVYQRRLVVMDEVASLTRAALADAPHDPVLNEYYLASLGAREATLRHLATSLPGDAQLSRF